MGEPALTSKMGVAIIAPAREKDKEEERLAATLTKQIDPEKLRALCPGLERFLQFENEIEAAIARESEDRRLDIDEKKRVREKKARKKRLKRQAATAAG